MELSARMRFAAAALLIASFCALGGCERSSTPEGSGEKAAAEPTAAMAPPVAKPLATSAAPPVIEAEADRAEEPFEDDLVLLAEGEPDWGEAPLTVHFTVESLIMDQMNEPKFTWNFGDGSPESQEAKPIHTYTKPGNYAVTIKIVDATGETGWDELDIEVTEPPAKDKGANQP